MDDELRQLRVSLGFFGRGGELEKIVQFTAATDAQGLADVGESFVVRGIQESGEVEQVALNDAAQVRRSAAEHPHPLTAADAPIELEITYDGRPVTIEYRDGKAFVREPAEGQQVALILKRKNPADRRSWGCVLKVNGQNTLYKQRLRDIQCAKRILDPGDPPTTVAGYQLNKNQAEAFRVLSKAASQAREIDYGEDVGTISLTVFGQRRARPRRTPACWTKTPRTWWRWRGARIPRSRPTAWRRCRPGCVTTAAAAWSTRARRSSTSCGMPSSTPPPRP